MLYMTGDSGEHKHARSLVEIRLPIFGRNYEAFLDYIKKLEVPAE